MRTVLLVEDSAGDAMLLRKALATLPEAPAVVQARDGGEAWTLVQDYLAAAPAQRPALMILDIGLPGDDGLDVLERLRRDAPGATWPMVMLTSSMQPHDVKRAKDAGAVGYFAKPLTFQGYVELANSLRDRFLRGQDEGPA